MKLVHDNGFEARDVAAGLDAGARRIHLRGRPGHTGFAELPKLLAGQDGATLVITEFERLKSQAAEIAAGLGKDAVGPWGEAARVTVANYEKVGLYLRFAPRDAFSLVVLQPHTQENARSARAIAGHFSDAPMVQVTTSGPPAFEPDRVLVRASAPEPARTQDNVVQLRAAS